MKLSITHDIKAPTSYHSISEEKHSKQRGTYK